MRKQLWQSDGRLKTGRISLIFFLCLLLGLGLLFKLQQPVDKAIVVVRHIFAAPQKTESENKIEKHNPVAKTDNKPVVKPKKIVPKVRPEPVKVVHVEPLEKLAAAASGMHHKSEKSQVLKNAVLKAAAEKPVAKIEKEESTQPAAATPSGVIEKRSVKQEKKPVKDVKIVRQELPESATTVESHKEFPAAVNSQVTSSPVDIMTEELVVAPPLLQTPNLQSEEPARQTGVTLLTQAQRQLLLPKPAAVKPEKKPATKVKFLAIKPLNIKKIASKEQVRPGKSVFKSVSAKLPAQPEIVQRGKTSGITVAKKEYKELYHAWQAAGRSAQDNDHVIPLQIENLRAAYDLLQMKAVVIRPDESCVDLSDGSRIPVASLDRFSSTVLRVDDPWQKWGAQLKAAGLQPGQPFQVRYYLYDFIQHSIYVRVNQAFQWSLAQGLIQAGTKPDEVDVLGKTFVIKRAGGGAFGVFVPLSLQTRSGHRVTIDPVCFRNAPDINALHRAGLI